MEDVLKLRALLSAAKKRETGLKALVGVLAAIAICLSVAVAYLVINRDVPLIDLAPDVSLASTEPGAATASASLLSLPSPRISEPSEVRLPKESGIGLDRRDTLIDTLDVFAKQDGIFSPCFPQDHNNSQIPADVVAFLDGVGMNEDELRYIGARYVQVWNRYFRDMAQMLPGDSQNRLANCMAMMEGWQRSDEGLRSPRSAPELLAKVRTIVNN